MKINLAQYSGKKICVAVSGGKDSMALMHFMRENAEAFQISLCAVNCDHMIRGSASASDSAFVKDICAEWNIPLERYKAECTALSKNRGVGVETFARDWRRACYFDAVKKFKADCVATAHHMNDNAETVLFNLARGAGLSGMTGITDGYAVATVDYKSGLPAKGVNPKVFELIRPLIGCTRAEIDAYIKGNAIPYVEDETNLSDGYTRNYIRHNVVPALEKAVPSAVNAIYRFSQLAAEDEKYFENIIRAKKLINPTIWGVELYFCREKPVFTRACIAALKLLKEDVKDYTFSHIERLYDLQFAGIGKKFEFLSFTAYSESGRIAICRKDMLDLKLINAVAFSDFTECNRSDYYGHYIEVCGGVDADINEKYLRTNCPHNLEHGKIKTLKFDLDKIPENAAVRFMQAGDRFTKFGGGTKNLGDYFTDRKIPIRVRGIIPLVADGNDVLIVCGVEISDKVKITPQTENIKAVITADYTKL